MRTKRWGPGERQGPSTPGHGSTQRRTHVCTSWDRDEYGADGFPKQEASGGLPMKVDMEDDYALWRIRRRKEPLRVARRRRRRAGNGPARGQDPGLGR